MIVLSEALVLAEQGTPNANDPQVGYHNIVTAENLTADGEDADYPASNLATPSTAEKWVGADDAEQYLTWVTGEVDPIDYCAVARHNFGSLAIPVSVEGQAEEGGDWEELVEERILADDAPVLFRFAAQSLYAARLRLQPGDGIPSAAVLYAGRLLALQRRIYVGHVPITFGRESSVTNGRSESGEFLGRIVTGERLASAINLQNLTAAWVRTYLKPFLLAAAETPFFFAWRPGSYPAEVGFVWATDDPKPANARSNGMMSVSIAIAGLAL